VTHQTASDFVSLTAAHIDGWLSGVHVSGRVIHVSRYWPDKRSTSIFAATGPNSCIFLPQVWFQSLCYMTWKISWSPILKQTTKSTL